MDSFQKRPLYTVDKGIACTAPYMSGLFNSVCFSEVKHPDSLRVFCLGGSITYGRPYDGNASYSKWLELLLADLCSRKRIEVINAGGISCGSKRIAEFVREVLSFEPDLIIAEVGHNEFLEQGILTDVRTTHRDHIERMSTLNGMTDDQALQLLLQGVLPNQGTPAGSGAQLEIGGQDQNNPHPHAPQRYNNRSIFPDRLDTILDTTIPCNHCRRDAALAENGEVNFVHNIETIISQCKSAGVPLLFLEPVSNLKDFSPIRSEHRAGLGPGERREIRGLLRLMPELIHFNRFQEVLRIAEDVIKADQFYAESHYYKGMALLGLGRSIEAFESLIKAKDLDAVPLRCTSTIREHLLGLTRQEGVDLIALSEAVERRTGVSEGDTQVPGYETFVDHIHPAMANHQLVAELIVDSMIEHGMVQPSCALDTERCKEVYERGMDFLDSKYLAGADLNLACFFAWAGKPEALWALERTTANLEENRAVVHALKGHVLMNEGIHWDAIGEFEKAVELSQDNPEVLSYLGTAYWHSDLTDEAMECFKALIRTEVAVSDPLAHKNMALLYLEADEVHKAKEVLQSGMRRNPASVTLLAPYARVFAASGEYSKAIHWMLRAAYLEPHNSYHLVDLAVYYSRLRRTKDAVRLLDLAVQRGVDDEDEIAEIPEVQELYSIEESGEFFHQKVQELSSPSKRRWLASVSSSSGDRPSVRADT